MDDNVIPVVEELRRRLHLRNTIQEAHGYGKELGGQQDGEMGEEDGKLSKALFCEWMYGKKMTITTC